MKSNEFVKEYGINPWKDMNIAHVNRVFDFDGSVKEVTISFVSDKLHKKIQMEKEEKFASINDSKIAKFEKDAQIVEYFNKSDDYMWNYELEGGCEYRHKASFGYDTCENGVDAISQIIYVTDRENVLFCTNPIVGIREENSGGRNIIPIQNRPMKMAITRAVACNNTEKFTSDNQMNCDIISMLELILNTEERKAKENDMNVVFTLYCILEIRVEAFGYLPLFNSYILYMGMHHYPGEKKKFVIGA